MKKFLILALPAALLASCSMEPLGSDNAYQVPVEVEDTEISESTDLFYEEQEDPSTCIFKSNDTWYKNQDGYTLWTTTDTNESEDFEPINVTLEKTEGRANAGFGVVFCSQKINRKPYVLCVLIDANRNYTIGKVIDGYFYHITEDKKWHYSQAIQGGLGVQNTIEVSYDKDERKFILKINGYKVTDFTADAELTFKGSRSGYVVVIADNESYPNSHVWVTFKNNNKKIGE